MEAGSGKPYNSAHTRNVLSARARWPETIWDYSLTPIMDNEKPGTVRLLLVSAVEITEPVQARKELERSKSTVVSISQSNVLSSLYHEP